MGSLNKACVIGNLGRDADLRYTPGGTAVANFSVATTDKYKDRQGDWQEKTEWHRIVMWGKMAEALAEYLTKGKQIYVEGKLETRQWEDKDGNKRQQTEIVARDVVLLGGGGGAGGRRRGGESRSRQVNDDMADDNGGGDPGVDPGVQPEGDMGEPLSDDDIPF